MKDFKNYFEEAEELMGNEGEAASTPAPEPQTEAPIEEPEATETESDNSKPVGIKLKDSVFLDENGNLIVQLVKGKQITPDEYLQKYLPALLTAAKYEEK